MEHLVAFKLVFLLFLKIIGFQIDDSAFLEQHQIHEFGHGLLFGVVFFDDIAKNFDEIFGRFFGLFLQNLV